jgi:hypothetical protein
VSRLSSFPTALLSLLGSQNFGESPNELGQMVVPTVDIGELFALTKQVPVFGQLAAPAIGNNAGQGIVVPSGEVWRVMYGGLFVNCGAGVSGEFTPTLLVEGSSCPLAMTYAVAASTQRQSPVVQVPMWIQAGTELGCTISPGLVLVPTVSMRYVVQKFRA